VRDRPASKLYYSLSFVPSPTKTQHFVDTEASSTLRCMTQRCLASLLALFQALAKSSAAPKSHRF